MTGELVRLSFPELPLERTFPHVGMLLDAYGLDGDRRLAVVEGYEVIREHIAPFIVEIAERMLVDLRLDVAKDPGHRIVFLGRDGHSYAAAIRGLDPEFFAAHCIEVSLSGTMFEAALQDRESHGDKFPQLDGFRKKPKLDPAIIPGAFHHLTDFFHRSGVPVGIPGSGITYVDDGFAASAQELSAAMYPENDFVGRYAFRWGHPADPNPGTKCGYVVDMESQDNVEHKKRDLPSEQYIRFIEDWVNIDPNMTFIWHGHLLEFLFQGPFDSVSSWGDSGPYQVRQQDAVGKTDDRYLNPAMVEPRYRSPIVREGVRAAALVAVHDEAICRREGLVTRAQLEVRSAQFTRDLHAYCRRKSMSNPRLQRFLNNFVHPKPNLPQNRLLYDAFREMNVPEHVARPIWKKRASLDWEEVKGFVERIIADLRRRQSMPIAVARRGFPAGRSPNKSSNVPRSHRPPTNPATRRQIDGSSSTSRDCAR